MSRTVSAALKAGLAANPHRLVRLLTIKRPDGAVFRLCDGNRDVIVGADTYTAKPGFRTSQVTLTNDGNVGTLDLALPNAPAFQFSTGNILAGVWEHSSVSLAIADRSQPTAGVMEIFEGLIGAASYEDDGQGFYTFEVRGRIDLGRAMLVETYGPTCRADLGDARCRWPLLSNGRTGTVNTIAGRTITATLSDVPANGYLDGGTLQWQSGANKGFAQEVRRQIGGSISLWLSPRFPIAKGDTFTVYPGCDKRLETCMAKFNNLVNFQGEPYLPGSDFKLSYESVRQEVKEVPVVVPAPVEEPRKDQYIPIGWYGDSSGNNVTYNP